MNFYVIYPSLRAYHILKEAEDRGYKMYSLPIYDESDLLLRNSHRIRTYFQAKCLTDQEPDEDMTKSMTLSEEAVKMSEYIKNLETFDLKFLQKREGDIILAFDESMIFEAACIGKFISPYTAWICSCKHSYYHKLNIDFKLIKTKEDFLDIDYKDFIIKPSINGVGKRNVFRIKSIEDKESLFKKDPDFFTYERPYIIQEYIKHVEEIWTMVFFDNNYKPYLLWFSTEKGHATFSPFEVDLYEQINKINSKLKIKNWIAYMQFFISEDGSLKFCDLNPRLPGDDFWYEDLYTHLSGGYSFSKILLDLIIDYKPPNIIKTNNIVIEGEYDSSKPLQDNQKKWDYSDNYKKIPLLTFKKLDLS